MGGLLRFVALLLILFGLRTFVITKHLVDGGAESHPIIRFYELPVESRIVGIAMIVGGIGLGLIVGRNR